MLSNFTNGSFTEPEVFSNTSCNDAGLVAFLTAFIIFLVIGSIPYCIWQMTNAVNREIAYLRNTPSHQLHQRLEYSYRNSVGIKTDPLREVKRYPTVTYVDDLATMKRTITVVEDLAWVMPVKMSQPQWKRRREEEEVGLMLRELHLEGDQEAQRGARHARDDPPGYEEEGVSLLRFRDRVNP